MRLEADTGRPEASPPLRRGVQTADRAVVRERQAVPGYQGRVRHRAIDPAALGPRHPQRRLHPGRGQPHARAERAYRAEEARPAVGDGGGRFRTSGASATSCANRACGHVCAQAVRTAQDAVRRGQAREPVGPAGPTATPHARVRLATLPMSASAEAGRTCACWPAWRTGVLPAIPPGGPGTRA